jgi:hypothetical protein
MATLPTVKPEDAISRATALDSTTIFGLPEIFDHAEVEIPRLKLFHFLGKSMNGYPIPFNFLDDPLNFLEPTNTDKSPQNANHRAVCELTCPT